MSNRISFGVLKRQGLDNAAGGSNSLVWNDVNRLSTWTNDIRDTNFYAFLGASVGVMGTSSTAFKLGDYTSSSAINMAANTQADPITITAFGRGSSGWGNLTNAITFDGSCGSFGIRSTNEASRSGSYVNNGESLTFKLEGGKILKNVEFVAKADPWAFLQSRSTIVLDVDGAVFAGGSTLQRQAAVTLDVWKGAKVAIDFDKQTVSVNGIVQRGTQFDNFFKAAANAPDKVTIGSAGGAAFSIDNLIIDRGDLWDASGKMTAKSMIHDAQGVATLADGSKAFFHGTNSKGEFVYGKEALTDTRKASYDLTKEDVAFLLKQAELGVVAPKNLVDKSDARGVRNLDGSGNNVANGEKGLAWGKANTNFERLVDQNIYDLGDKTGTTPNTGPNPRDISNAILNQAKPGTDPNVQGGNNAGANDKDLRNNFGGNELFTSFGQYYDHGLDFLIKGGTGDPVPVGNKDFPIDPLNRGAVAPGTGVDGKAREHINQTAQYIDQNQAYGSNSAILEFLLERDSAGNLTAKLLNGKDGGLPTLGELKANWQKGVAAGKAEAFKDAWISDFKGSGQPLLIDINRGIPLDAHFVAGDGRVNENLGLTAVHTIWKNNHNYWVDYLTNYLSKDATYAAQVKSGAITQREIFEMAKIINEAEYQRAVFDEFTELMVGSNVHAFRDYNPNINVTVTHEFAAAAFRLGHSMLNNTLTVEVDGQRKEMPLFAAFLAPDQIQKFGGAKGIVGGMISSLHQEIDTQMVTTLRNQLVGRPLDLASLNIARGRDLGLPTLNEMREMAGLKRYANWAEFGANLRYAEDLAKFKAVYGSADADVNKVELWVGGLAEKPKSANGLGNDTVLGETFTYVFSVQQIALQDGDRFYYKHRLFETNVRQEIQSQDFSQIIERTLGLEYLQAEVFTTIENKIDARNLSQNQLVISGTDKIEVIIGRNIGETIYGEGANGKGHVFDRQAMINQLVAADAVAVQPPEGPAPANKRQVDGDTIYARGGDDVVIGGDTDDALYGGDGDDLLVGNDGDDRFDGGLGNDVAFGGLGDDDMAGNEGDDTLYAGLGDDEAFGGAGNDKVYGGKGSDNLWGGDGNDLVDGGDGDDFVAGGEGNDVLLGGAGNDRLIGGGGNDTMTGGAGSDTFQFLPGSGRDTIEDFNGSVDRIDLHRYRWEAKEQGKTFGLDQLVFKNVAGGVEISGVAGSVFADATIMVKGQTATTMKNAQLFIFEDVVNVRDGLLLSKDNLVIGAAGAGNKAMAVPPPPPPPLVGDDVIVAHHNDGISLHI